MYGPYTHGWMFEGGIGMLFGTLWLVLFLVLPVALLAVLLKYLFGRPRARNEAAPAPPNQAPLDVLKERYARGEIDRAEFLQKRDDMLEK